jgi:hypothetical protein
MHKDRGFVDAAGIGKLFGQCFLCIIIHAWLVIAQRVRFFHYSLLSFIL